MTRRLRRPRLNDSLTQPLLSPADRATLTAPAPQRRKRFSSVSKSAGAPIRSSRQARCQVGTPAAGIDAASMAASMPLPNIKTVAAICPNRQATTSEGRCGTLIGEVKEGGPAGPGGTRANQSPTPTPAPTKPACNVNGRQRQRLPPPRQEPILAVRSVTDHRNSSTGETLCCHPQRAGPRIA